MKGHKIRLLAILLLFGILLCGCGLQNHVYTETGLKKVAEKSLKKKYNEEFVIHNVWSKNQDVFYADCSPKNNAEIVFRADIYKNGKGVEADGYKKTILEGEINRKLKPYFEDVFGNCYTRVLLGMSYEGGGKIDENQPIDVQIKEYFNKYSSYIVCDIYVEMQDISKCDLETEYEFLRSTLLEKIQSDICPDINPDLKVNLRFVDEEMLEKSENYFQNSTGVRGDFDWELRKYQEIICVYEDGNIDMKYEDYREQRLLYKEYEDLKNKKRAKV